MNGHSAASGIPDMDEKSDSRRCTASRRRIRSCCGMADASDRAPRGAAAMVLGVARKFAGCAVVYALFPVLLTQAFALRRHALNRVPAAGPGAGTMSLCRDWSRPRPWTRSRPDMPSRSRLARGGRRLFRHRSRARAAPRRCVHQGADPRRRIRPASPKVGGRCPVP